MKMQIVQDIVCPWCRIGKRNLDRAIAQSDATVELEWVPYLLDRVEPGSSEPFQQRLRERKQMSQEHIEGMFARVKEAGENVGLAFDFDKIEVAVDTVPAHQMLSLAPTMHQSGLLDALYTAYFEEGRNIGDTEELAKIGLSVGMAESDIERMRGVWASDQLRDEMIKVVERVQESGITGVPYFIIDASVGVSGAQPPDVLREAMEQAVAG
jgi:predicted DsbA family dithiol-disulfide isomerase